MKAIQRHEDKTSVIKGITKAQEFHGHITIFQLALFKQTNNI